LMTCVLAGQALQLGTLDRLHRDAQFAGVRNELRDTRIAAALLHAQLAHALGIVCQGPFHGIDADDPAVTHDVPFFDPVFLRRVRVAVLCDGFLPALFVLPVLVRFSAFFVPERFLGVLFEDVPATSRKSIFRSSMLARNTCTVTASPRRNTRLVRSPLSS